MNQSRTIIDKYRYKINNENTDRQIFKFKKDQ